MKNKPTKLATASLAAQVNKLEHRALNLEALCHDMTAKLREYQQSGRIINASFNQHFVRMLEEWECRARHA